MRKVPEAVRAIITANPFLHFGLAQRLFNLSKLAKYLLPLVEAATLKQVSPSAILISLSRLGREIASNAPKPGQFRIENISVQSELCVLSIENTADNHALVSKLYRQLRAKSAYMTLTEGRTQITLIFEQQQLETVTQLLKAKPIYLNKNVASISLQFNKEYLQRAGFLYSVLQQLALQSINLVEIASTSSELMLYLASKDVRLAFDTLYKGFHKS